VLATNKRPQFRKTLWAFFRNLRPNFFERWKFHVDSDSVAPFDPSLIRDPLFVMEKRLLVGKVNIPENRVSTMISAFIVEGYQL
jgi:hypothetical protein